MLVHTRNIIAIGHTRNMIFGPISQEEDARIYQEQDAKVRIEQDQMLGYTRTRCYKIKGTGC